LHLMGAVPGFAIAVFMLKFRRVDCDGYDMLSIWRGKRGERVLTIEQEKERDAEIAQQKLDRKRTIEEGLTKIDQYVSNGHYDMALNRIAMLRKKNRSIKMTEAQLVTIVKAFDKDPATKAKAIPVIETYLEHYQTYKIPFSLMLARANVLTQDRPRAGLKVLKTLSWNDLNPKQKDFVEKLIKKAKQKIAAGVLEVE